MGKILLLYSVTGMMIGAVAGMAGGSIAVVLIASLLVPPTLHLLFLLARSRG